MAQGQKDNETLLNEERDRRVVVELARKNPTVHEGELEIDEDAIVSWGADHGAYVQAWLWVDITGTYLEEKT